jgi:hypothetical protein
MLPLTKEIKHILGIELHISHDLTVIIWPSIQNAEDKCTSQVSMPLNSDHVPHYIDGSTSVSYGAANTKDPKRLIF